MFTALVFAVTAVAAPVPKDSQPPGPPPRMMDLVADSDGKIMVDAIRTEKKTVTRVVPVTKEVKVKVLVNGQEVEETRTVTENQTQEIEVPVRKNVRVELSEVQELTIYTGDGKVADREMALKKLAEGGAVVVSNDGKKVDPKYLKLLRDDSLVLVSPELALPIYLPGAVPGRAGGELVPAFPNAPLPAAAAVAPGGVVPPPPPAGADKKADDKDKKADDKGPGAAPPQPPPLPPPPVQKKDDKKDDKKKD